VIKISGEFDDDDGEYGADYEANDVDPENDPEISNDNDQDYDSDNATESRDYEPNDVDPENDPEISNENDQDYDSDIATESGDYDPNDVDPENDTEISNDNDQDYDSDIATESGDKYNPFKPPDFNKRDPDYNPFKPPDFNKRDPDYNPFKPPDFNKRDPDYNPFKPPDFNKRDPNYNPFKPPDFNKRDPNYNSSKPPDFNKRYPDYNSFKPPDYGNKEEIEDKSMERHTGEEQNEFPENLSRKEENLEENMEEYSEPEIKQQEPNLIKEEQEEEQLNPNKGNLDEIDNPNNQSTVTILISERPGLHSEQEQDSEIELKSKTEIEFEIEQFEKPEIPPEAFDIMRELQEMGIAIEDHLNDEMEYENDLNYETEEEEKKDEGELENESELEQKSEHKPELESESEIKLEQKSEHEPDLIPEKKPEVIQEKELDLISEQLPEVIQEKEPDLISEQLPEVIQEKEPGLISDKKPEVIHEKELDLISEQKLELIPEQELDLKEIYHQETGRRSIYARKETKGFIEWREKNKLLTEKEKETTEPVKEIREFKEEWAQYLAISIEESSISDDVKENLSDFLENYGVLKELIEKIKAKEISEEKFKQGLKKFEDILIEKRNIANPLFMNFDWFRRYYNEMIRKYGRRVANLYISKKTREFLSRVSERIERLENLRSPDETAEKFEEYLGKSFQIREKWALLLTRLIHEVPNKEISKEAKRELESVIKRYCEIIAIRFNDKILKADKEKLIQGRIEKSYPRFFNIFEILKRFLGIYDYYSRNWMEQSLIIAGKKTIRRLSQKLKTIKEEVVQAILNGDNSTLHKFKENLRVNLYKSTELTLNEKSKLIKIIQKKDISENDRKEIMSMLGSLSKRELKAILNSFKIDEKNANETEPINLMAKDLTITNSFRGNLYHKVRNLVYSLILKFNLTHKNFNNEDFIVKILSQLGIPSTYEEIDHSSIMDKKTRKLSLKNKKIYISVLGKIMIDILNFSKSDSITDISKRYNVSRDFTTKTAKFLAMKHSFELKDRFPTTSARGSGSLPSKKTLDKIKVFSSKFKDSKLLIEIAIEFFKDLVTGPHILTVDDLPLGCKTNPKYLAISLIYYALRHINYTNKYSNYESYGILEFIYDNFPNDTTMKLAITNTVPALYDFISRSIKKKILYHPKIKHPRENYDRLSILKLFNNLKEKYKKISRPDNIVLIYLLESTLSYYKKGQFQQFINDLLFWIKKDKAWILVERISTPNTLQKISDLKYFLKNYSKLINKLHINKNGKEKLHKILTNFEEERIFYFNYEDKFKEKRRREYERYLTYGVFFFSTRSRIKRFLLMLGFSPYDGFDLWDNKIIVDGRNKIFANFHHYHYKPKEQSEKDLVFIPIKPPKKIRTKVYQENKFLSHHMIAGREGHLKKTITSPQKKREIQAELDEFEKQIEYNSRLIEEAVLTQNKVLLKNLFGWTKNSINKAKSRLLDKNFTWAIGIEEAIPLAKEYGKREISQSDVKKIIQGILKQRKKNVIF